MGVQKSKALANLVMGLARIELLDRLTQQPIFHKQMWLSIWGARKKELSDEQIYWAFRIKDHQIGTSNSWEGLALFVK